MIFKNETQFTDAVIDLAKMFPWLVHHDRGEMRRHIQGHVGFPDLFCVRPADYRRQSPLEHRVFAAELKFGKGKPTTEQQRWIDALSSAMLSTQGEMIKCYLWYPSDWPEIVKVLSGAS